MKPAFATLPMPGVEPVLMDEAGEELTGNDVQGNLCIKRPWPGMARTLYGDYERFRGRLARFKMAQPVRGQTVVIGRIQKLDGTHVWVEVQAAKGNRGGAATPVALPLAEILEARLEVEF